MIFMLTSRPLHAEITERSLSWSVESSAISTSRTSIFAITSGSVSTVPTIGMPRSASAGGAVLTGTKPTIL